jgi:endonuclease/exonuclease/phosphatase (EEP) superfamily protein YafD
VQAYNRHKGRLAPMIMDHDPDVIVLLETTESWLEVGRNILVAYPHHVGLPMERGAGISVYSRLAIGKRDVVYPGDVGMPAILAEIRVGMQAVSLMAVHNVPPLPLSYLPRGVKQMEAVANIANASASPFILAGDLNTSMWGPTYRYLIDKTELKNSREGFGIAGTFPEALAPVLVPIDHVLVDEAWSVQGSTVGEAFGSDHLPLVVDLRLKPAPAG